MAPFFISQILDFPGAKLLINYGLDKMKLMEPVKVNSKLRLRLKLLSAKNLRGTIKATVKLTFEIQGNDKPACQAEATYLYRF